MRLALALALALALLPACAPAESTATWVDPETGLVWQDPLFTPKHTWTEAEAACASLSLDGHDDWRLPTIDELRTLVRGCSATEPDGACPVTTSCLDASCYVDACYGCKENGGPGSEGSWRVSELHGDYMTSWTSSELPDVPDRAWTVGFGGGHVLPYPKLRGDLNVRCVRGSP